MHGAVDQLVPGAGMQRLSCRRSRSVGKYWEARR